MPAFISFDAQHADMPDAIWRVLKYRLPPKREIFCPFLVSATAAAGIALVDSLGKLSRFSAPYLVRLVKEAMKNADAGLHMLALLLMIRAVLVLFVKPLAPAPHSIASPAMFRTLVLCLSAPAHDQRRALDLPAYRRGGARAVCKRAMAGHAPAPSPESPNFPVRIEN